MVATRESDRHVHLKVTASRPAWDWARWLVVVLALAGVGAFAGSFFLPWWHFFLYAPQYPNGLELVITMRGIGGDVHEINLLNHYIGMGHLDNAAHTELQYAAAGIVMVAVLTLGLALAAGKKVNALVAIPAAMLPLGFIADSYYWLWWFGHHLDPKAPLKIGAFTPQMFGNGKIGQFETYATPSMGFWLAVAGAVMVVVAVVVRSRVCANCARAGTCGAACPRLLVLPGKK
jgi:copper chaperone NosL